MAYKQLVAPDLSVVGTVGGCLSYARRMFGAPGGTLYASQAWRNTQYKHADQDFPSVAILIWFDYFIGGSNQGHVATRLPDGLIYSSPYKLGTGHAVLNSITELIRMYSENGKHPMRYLGWSEDINGVRVAINEGENMQPPAPYETANLYAQELLFRSMSHEEWEKFHKDKNRDQLFDAFRVAPERLAKLETWKAVAQQSGNCTPDERMLLDYLKKVTRG